MLFRKTARRVDTTVSGSQGNRLPHHKRGGIMSQVSCRAVWKVFGAQAEALFRGAREKSRVSAEEIAADYSADGFEIGFNAN